MELVASINNEMGLDLPVRLSAHELRLRLHEVITRLIATDFSRLAHILYRVDVDEKKLKYLLHENVGEDAAMIMADLIIARQAEKLRQRQQFSAGKDVAEDDGEERW